MTRWQKSSPYLLTALLAGAGVTHFVKPGFYDPIVPHALPGPPRAWTYASGVAELGVAAAVVRTDTRKRGALAALALFVAVFPANVQMAADAKGAAMKAVAYGRLPLQVPLVVWAWKVSRQSRVSTASGRSGSRVRSR
ncbi:MAG: DoxX family protein [Mycobacteriales bacterium]